MKIFASLLIISALMAASAPTMAQGDPVKVSLSGMARCYKDSQCIRLTIENNGSGPVTFGVEGRFRPTIPEPLYTYQFNRQGTWTDFATSLGTYLAPNRKITIKPGQSKNLYVQFSDLSQWSNGDRIRLSIQDASRVMHYTPPFDSSGSPISNE
ncbi:hypothetical protein [Lysobacter sp. CFH 32150]|uniref:hypothetical protein n=1 Tax=Lysobacter sp. CFH 32150 TaxID=2927128 RepID=UPI001FA7237F|nr:hypothetical protein [Lysobacter sp. CFH 32150]MCI4569503.1 hypothetical protein [Lysobacter sp. CFH 32150]